MTTSTMQRTVSARLPTAGGIFQLIHYRNAHDDKEHLALVMGDVRHLGHQADERTYGALS